MGSRTIIPSSNLLRSVRACRPNTYCSIRKRSTLTSKCDSGFHTTTLRTQETSQQRYGNAASPGLPPPPRPENDLTPTKRITAGKNSSDPDNHTLDHKETSIQLPSAKGLSQDDKTAPAAMVSDSAKTFPQDATESKEEQKPTPLDIVLQTPPTNKAQRGEQQRHPHLEASPYEHHFDTYSLVQELAKGGFTEDQAVTIMKAVRLILALNLDIAKEGLVSKSDDENETYLFRAACSELGTSLQTSRHSEIQHQRTQRAHLHHEYDILNQKVSQDMLSLREELKAMFNDRKMAVQEDKQRLDSKISELNYEITVLLNSDSKSEVEGLRWVLTRRAAMAIAISALMTLMSLNYSSHMAREKEEAEKKHAAAEKKAEERDQARYTTPARDQGTQTAISPVESLG